MNENLARQSISYSLFEVCAAMTSTLELEELLSLILDLTMRELGADRGSVLLQDPGSDVLRMLASRGMPDDVVERGYIPRAGSIAEWVIAQGEPVLLDDDVRDDRFTSIVESPLRSSICCPLKARDNTIGALNVSRYAGDHFTENNVRDLTIMATQAAISIENARLMTESVRNARLAAIGETVAGVSHCVKNILTILNGGVSQAERGLAREDWDMIATATEMLRRGVSRVSVLVTDLLQLARDPQSTPTPQDVRALLNDVASTVEHTAVERGVSLDTQFDDDTSMQSMDGMQLYRCLLNLATNAVEAVSEGDGHVTLGVKTIDGEGGPAVQFTISDDGPGVPKANQTRVFDPFFSTKGSKGTGLGLAVARKIASDHGGTLELSSESGNGTTFKLTIPSQSR